MKEIKNQLHITVGKNIKKYRLAKGMSVDELSKRIYKAKSTISKYENGLIAIDIKTLEDLAEVFEICPTKLLAEEDREICISSQTGAMQILYLYSYDGQTNRIIKSVLEKYSTTTVNHYDTQLFYDTDSLTEYGNCKTLYEGQCNDFDISANYTFSNSKYPIEQIFINSIGGLSQSQIQIGFLTGLLSASLLPAIRKVVISPKQLNDDILMSKLMFSKEGIKNIKKDNLIVIDQFIV